MIDRYGSCVQYVFLNLDRYGGCVQYVFLGLDRYGGCVQYVFLGLDRYDGCVQYVFLGLDLEYATNWTDLTRALRLLAGKSIKLHLQTTKVLKLL